MVLDFPRIVIRLFACAHNLTNRVLPEFLNVAVTIERNDGSCSTCHITPINEVYAGKTMLIEVSTDFVITMPFLGAFTGQTIPLRADANGIIIRPQPPKD